MVRWVKIRIGSVAVEGVYIWMRMKTARRIGKSVNSRMMRQFWSLVSLLDKTRGWDYLTDQAYVVPPHCSASNRHTMDGRNTAVPNGSSFLNC